VNRRYILVLALAIILTSLIIITPLAKKWELWAYDYRLSLAGNLKKLDKRIRIIGVDEESLNELGQWPWPRKIHARLVDKLSELKAESIVFDILFDNPDRCGKENDLILAQSIEKSDRVILPFKFEKTSYLAGKEAVFPIPALKGAAAGIGVTNIQEDIDGKVRKIILAFPYKGKIYPSIDLAALAYSRGIGIDKIRYLNNKIVVGDFIIATNKDYQIYINFFADSGMGVSSSSVLAPISYKKILEIDKDNRLFSSGIYFVGATAKGLKDYFLTPAGYISGIAIHANVLNTLLKQRFIAKVNPIYEIIVWFILGILAIFIFPRLKAYRCLTLFLIVLGVYVSGNFYFFHRGLWMNLVNPLVFLFLVFAFVETYQFMRTHKLFGQFVSHEVVDEMLAQEKKQKLGGEEKEVTIMFSDIRGYTTLSEKMRPNDVMELLNVYHSRMGKIFSRFKGRIFDYQGDAQMVVFGAPVETKEHAFLAVQAAREMQKEIKKLKTEWKKEIPMAFDVGIGISTGSVAIGIVGGETHKQYTAIGDSVNISSRLQALSRELGCNILMTEATYKLVKDKVEAKLFPKILLKGKSLPMDVYGVIEV